MIFYLTYNDAPSGIFSSQVIDVVKFIKSTFNVNIRLVAFISIRSFSLNKRKIKQQLPDAIVLPMFPKVTNWAKNSLLLSIYCIRYKPEVIIGRSVLATKLALKMRDKKYCSTVTYDGRGAIAAEWKEYDVVADQRLLNVIRSYEGEVVNKTDHRIAVSNALVAFWKREFSYNAETHLVIPCTLNSIFENNHVDAKSIDKARKELGLNSEDIVFVYSGSIAGWQSFELLDSFIEPLLKQDQKHKIVFFSPYDSSIRKLMTLYPDQIVCKHLDPNAVAENLIAGDYGLLIRERSITNQVASPVKYAEYLSCGLKVIISNELGDYSDLTVKKDWGFLSTINHEKLSKPSLEEKKRISSETKTFFSKKNYSGEYSKLILSNK